MGFSKIVASLDSTLCRSILKSNASSPTDQPITFTLSPALMSGDFPHHHDVMKVGRVHWPVWADGFKRARFV